MKKQNLIVISLILIAILIGQINYLVALFTSNGTLRSLPCYIFPISVIWLLSNSLRETFSEYKCLVVIITVQAISVGVFLLLYKIIPVSMVLTERSDLSSIINACINLLGIILIAPLVVRILIYYKKTLNNF